MNETERMENHNPLRLLAADLSLRCPGFAIMNFADGQVSVESLCHLDSRGTGICHGEALSAIYDKLAGLSADITVFVREKGFYRFPHETQAQFKVVGIADLVAWRHGRKEYYEIAPSTIKKLLTGSGKASKEEVAAALSRYVGEQRYATNDESDAVAAGLAWLIRMKMIGDGTLGS